MASVRKRSKSQYWYAIVRGPSGPPQHFSTGLTDKAAAHAAAVAAERVLWKHKEKPHQLRAALDRLANDFVPAGEEDPAAWLETWLKRRRGEVAETTASAYETTVTGAAAWFRAEGLKTFAAITTPRLMDLRDHWAKVSPGSANQKIKNLKIALADAVKERRIEESPAAGIAKLRVEKTIRREFRKAELDLFMPTLSGEWEGMAWLGLNTGQRLSDLATLTAERIDLKAATITFEAGKTGALVSLPLLPVALEVMRKLMKGKKGKDPIFPKIAATAQPSRSNAFRGLLSKVGLANDRNTKNKGEKLGGGRTTSELSFHSLRHTTTTMLKAAGVADSIARAIVGHESTAVSRTYTHLDIETMREAMSKVKALSVA